MVNFFRLAFIFLPAIIRGDLGSLSLYAPFAFGYILHQLVTAIKKKKWTILKFAKPIGMLAAFLGFCTWKSVEIKPLTNFFLSSFVSPMIQWIFPVYGVQIVHTLLALGLATAWIFQGVDTIFFGLLFLQVIPDIQRRLWNKPNWNIAFSVLVVLVCLPFVSIGLCVWWFPSFLDYFPVWYLRILCIVANARPNVPDYYEILGLPHDASDKAVRKAFRDAAVSLHPDKVGHDPILLEKYHKLAEASEKLTRPELKQAYDEELQNQELRELMPRCMHAVVMMAYWAAHLILDIHELDNFKEKFKADLRRNLVNGVIPLNYKVLGTTEEDLKDYAVNENNPLPFLKGNQKDDVLEFRKVLSEGGLALAPLPEGDDVIYEVVIQKRRQDEADIPENIRKSSKKQLVRIPEVPNISSKQIQKNWKTKKTRFDAFVRKKTGGGGSSCSIM